jgi:hypothetical protein
MNTDKTYLQRRVAFIQDILDKPSEYEVPHPKKSTKLIHCISEETKEHLKLDIAISNHIWDNKIDQDKLLFSRHQFKEPETTLTNFEYAGCFVDYCFVHLSNGLLKPYAIGLDIDDPFNGWWGPPQKIKLKYPTDYYTFSGTPLFFISQDQIFVQFYGIYSCRPNSNLLENVTLFNSWLEEMRLCERSIFRIHQQHPLKEGLINIK